MPHERCPHVKRDGERCKVTWGLDPKSGFCWTHNPDKDAERNAARGRGGRATAGIRVRTVEASEAPPRPTTAKEAAELQSWVAWAVLTSLIDARTAREATMAASGFVRSLHVSQIETEVKELRAIVKVAKAKGVL